LYAGLYRGAYISTDSGLSWNLLGRDMPATSVADIEIDLKTKDLVAATHGRGMYKLNLKPIHEGYANKVKEAELFTLPVGSPPKPFFVGNPTNEDNRKYEKLPITFWVEKAGEATVKILNKENEEVWTKTLETKVGYNQFRWDFILKKVDSPQPYFIRYKEFIESGSYQVQLTVDGNVLSKELVIKTDNE